MMFNKDQRGIALLIAALVSAVVIAVGAAIYSIVQKQVILSALSRDSEFAFYTADTAAECALYWDSRFGYFGATSTPPSTPAVCGSSTLSVTWSTWTGTYPFTSSFQYQANNLCALVTVLKCDSPITDAVHNTCASTSLPANLRSIRTSIIAYGYNVPCAATSSSPRVLQRAVRLNY